MFDFKQLADYILGNGRPMELLGAWIIALLGVFVSLLIDANTRDFFKIGSPVRFSWPYFIADNAFRFFKSAVILLVAVRFSDNLFGATISPWLAFFIGLAIDRIVEYFRELRKKGPNTITPNNDQP